MEAKARIVEVFRSAAGPWHFEEWFDSLPSNVQADVAKRLKRVESGLLGDSKPVGEGVSELRMHHGPGYRIYYGQDDRLILLLAGSDKSEQQRTIKLAIDLWKEYKSSKK